MMKNMEPRATIAVNDLSAARAFYEGKVGLAPALDEREPTTVTYRCGSFSLLVYESGFAGTNRATVVTWMAGAEVDATARALRAKGVAFESYDIPDAAKEGDVYVLGGIRAAWFKDPDGNILHLNSA